MKALLSAVLVATISVAVSFAQDRTSTGSQFVIDANKAYIYLLFDHVGKGPRFFDDEPATRIWFRFVNNCRTPITVRTFGPPDGSLKGEVGVMHDVVANPEESGIVRGIEAPGVSLNGRPEEPSAAAQTQVPMPHGYEFDVSSLAVILPGESILFSVPTTHLSEKWHIEIPYDFKVPSGKCCRPDNVGGEPKMVLLYSDWYLPDPVRKELKKWQ